MQYQLSAMYRAEENQTISFLSISSSNFRGKMGVNQVFDYCLLKMGNGGTQAVSRWVYDLNGNRVDNITDWALKQFTANYKTSGKSKKISKEAIFHYCYAVLHDPIYREKYALNLKREFLFGTN